MADPTDKKPLRAVPDEDVLETRLTVITAKIENNVRMTERVDTHVAVIHASLGEVHKRLDHVERRLGGLSLRTWVVLGVLGLNLLVTVLMLVARLLIMLASDQPLRGLL